MDNNSFNYYLENAGELIKKLKLERKFKNLSLDYLLILFFMGKHSFP